MNILPILNTTPTDKPAVIYMHRDPVVTPIVLNEPGVGVAINIDTAAFHMKAGHEFEWHSVDYDYKFCQKISAHITGLNQNMSDDTTIHTALVTHLQTIRNYMDDRKLVELHHSEWLKR